MANLLAPQSVGNSASAAQIIDMRREVFFLDPESMPYTACLNKFKKNRRTAKAPTFRNLQHRLLGEYTAINHGAGYGDADASLVVDGASIFNVHDEVYVPRTGEIMLVTARDAGTNTLTVVRGAGGEVAGAALNDDDQLRRLSPAYPEGGDVQNPVMRDVIDEYNHCQIFRTPYGATETAQQTDHYYGKPLSLRRTEKGIEHALEIERAALFGQRNILNANSDNPRRLTRGIVQAVKAVGSGGTVWDAGGPIYEDEFNRYFLEKIGEKGGEERWFYCTPRMITIMEQWGRGRSRLSEDQETSKKLGFRVRAYEGAHVLLYVIQHKMLTDPTGAYTGIAGVAVDPKSVWYCPLQGRDTKILRDRQAPGADQVLEEYLTEAGFDYGPQEPNGIILNATN